MPTSINDYVFDQVTADNGFFNEFESDLMNSIMITGSGVYRLTQNKLGQFTSAARVEEITEENVAVVDGRITIPGEEEDIVYVNFIV